MGILLSFRERIPYLGYTGKPYMGHYTSCESLTARDYIIHIVLELALSYYVGLRGAAMLAERARLLRIAIIAALVLLSIPDSAYARTTEASDSLLQTRGTRVFLDMPTTYHDYIRTEIAYVNYVRDRALAQVHILLTEEATGGGGTRYTLTFMGNQDFAGINDTLSFCADPSQSEEIVRSTIANLLKRGLMRYVAKTPFADFITISFKKQVTTTAARDKWDYWVFSISSQGYVQGEKTWNNMWLWSYLTANRVTPELKMDISVGTNYGENNFDVSGSTITSITRSQYFSGLIVKSIDDHWSYGLSTDLNASSYNNISLLAAVAPAVEYNVFPYSASTRRQLRVLYKVYYERAYYIEETIYGKVQEDLGKQALSVTWVARERWGSVTTSLSGSHFFHDFTKNRLALTCDLSLKLAKGFSFTLSGQAFMLHDLLSPAKGQASYEDILLRRKRIDTQYNYYFSFGLQYSFGSIYSNVVNPRFGN
jgi:hypothetical protein